MKNHDNQIQVNELSEATKVSMKTRIITAIVGLAIVVPLFVLGDWFMFALILAATGIGMYEVIRCGKGNYSIWLYILTIVVGLLIVSWPLIQNLINNISSSNGHVFDYYSSIFLSLPLLFVSICLLFLTVIMHSNFTVKDGTYIITMVIIVALGMESLLFVRYFPSVIANPSVHDPWFNSFDNFASCSFSTYGLIGTFFTDIGAYFIGVFFGKRKLNERISPKKTVEGFYGGIFISASFSAAFALILAAVGHPILPGVFDMAHWYNIVAMSFLMPFFATLGDFVFSAVKRVYEIKDFGNILPGHGGILDRVDSMVFVFTALALYTLLFYGISSGAGLLI